MSIGVVLLFKLQECSIGFSCTCVFTIDLRVRTVMDTADLAFLSLSERFWLAKQ